MMSLRHKSPVPSVLISVAGTGKVSWIYVRSLGGCFIVVVLLFAKKSLTKNRLVFWSIAVKEKPAVGSSFFGAFPSDCTL